MGLLVAVVSCGAGVSTRLVTKRPGTGQGPVDLKVENLTEVPVNSIFLAKTEAVDAADRQALDPGSAEGEALWGGDLLNDALSVGSQVQIAVPAAGRWNLLALDRDRREQHVAGLKLEAGGRYVLELHDGGWRAR